MEQQETRSRPAKSKATERGDFKLGVYFINHQQPQSKAYYFFSKKSQDRAGTAASHLKKLVFSKNWVGKVNWAGLYQNGVLLATFNREDGIWQNQ